MHPYYFDFDAARTRRATAILVFERNWRRGPPPPRREWRDLLHGAVTLVRLWHRRARERADLAHLDMRMLRDIGVTPSEAERECDKPFWRP
jgi:uncharacterized protein YjiS (DUF1127 family)